MLSIRMQAVADMVSEGMRLADIGTDHGFVPIALVSSGRLLGAIAADVRTGPLSHARANIEEKGLADRIETRLCDGLSGIRPGEADAIVIAGMGGMLMKRILSEGINVIRAAKELILQPQSDIPEIRRWLHDHQMRIEDERMVFDMGKYYVVIRAVHGADAAYDAVDDLYGRCLMAAGSAVLTDYLAKEKIKYQDIHRGLACQEGSEKSKNRLTEIEQLMAMNAEAARRNRNALKRKDT